MAKTKVAVLGLGHVGSVVLRKLRAFFLASDEFEARGFDKNVVAGSDLSDPSTLSAIVERADVVVACTPFFLNKSIVEACSRLGKPYFDLTEDISVSEYIQELNPSVPMFCQCGLAPGVTSIIANDLAKKFDRPTEIHIRVGALPSNPSNQMGYYRTWSTEGLINEYIHPCNIILNGKQTQIEPLELLEKVQFRGVSLEAATTSGGIGTLAQTWDGKINTLTYKTLRYPGHWNHMRFLKNDLGLKENFDDFVKIFNKSVPTTLDDKIFVLIRALGYEKPTSTSISEKSYTRVIGADLLDGTTAIQRSTANGLLMVLIPWLTKAIDPDRTLKGLVRQESIEWDSIKSSGFSEVYHDLEITF